jgi:iron complex outermembrane receptor protein
MKIKNQLATTKATRTAVAAAVAAALASPMVVAQQSTGGARVIEEIVVTATKRESSVADLAVSVTAIDGGLMKELNLVNVLDIDKVVPGLKVRYVGTNPNIILRGAGAAGTNDVAVPVYVDGLYRPRTGQALASYLDLERTEILRGPQGTLFGRNTFGGLVNLIAKKPDFNGFDYGISATFGDFSRQRYEGFVNFPMGEKVAARVSFNDTQSDPIIENIYDKKGGFRDEDSTYIRAQIRFEPTDTFDVTFTGTYWEDTSNGNAEFAGVALGIPVDSDGNTNGIDGVMQPRVGRLPGDESEDWPAAGGRTWAGTFGVDASASVIDDPRKISQDLRPERDIEETSFSMLANYDFGPAALRVNFGTFDYEEFGTADSDYSPNPSQWVIDNPGVTAPTINGTGYWQQCWTGPYCGRFSAVRAQSKAHQADINLNSTGDGPLQWTLGYFLYDDSGDGDTNREFVFAYQDTTDTSSATQMSWAHWLYQSNGGTKSTAIYGQAEYSFTDRLRGTLGLRRSEDERTSWTRYVDWGPSVHGWADGYYSAHYSDPGSRFASYPEFVSTDQTLAGKTIGKSDNTDYRASLQFDVSDNLMVFASAATGYIAGANEGGGGNGTTAPNEVETYELGLKGTLLDGAMKLNVTYYDSAYEGLTTSSFVAQGATILAVSTVSGTMDSSGLEVELDWLPTDDLRIRAGLALQDAKLDKFGRTVLNRVFRAGGDDVVLGEGITDPALCDSTCSQVYVLDGQQARFSPDYTLSLDASYNIDMGDNGTLVPGVLLYASDDYKTTNVPYFFSLVDSYVTLDLRVSWYSANSPLSVQAYFLNATDELVQIGSDQFSQGRAIADFNNPRTWGLRLSYNF